MGKLRWRMVTRSWMFMRGLEVKKAYYMLDLTLSQPGFQWQMKVEVGIPYQRYNNPGGDCYWWHINFCLLFGNHFFQSESWEEMIQITKFDILYGAFFWRIRSHGMKITINPPFLGGIFLGLFSSTSIKFKYMEIPSTLFSLVHS